MQIDVLDTISPARPLESTTTPDAITVGIISFIASEAIFFLLLILSYVYYGAKGIQGPNAVTSLDPLKTGLFSLALFSSSGTLWLADRSYQKGRQRSLIIWLLVTIGLGLVFLVGQGLEYLNLFGKSITPNTNLFGTTFFTLTGFHGLHVLVGLIALTVVTGLALAGDFKNSKTKVVSTVSLYWHFVDMVWVFIFTIVYLLV